jgi:hypothetical protein
MSELQIVGPAYVQPVIVFARDTTRNGDYEEKVNESFRRSAGWFRRVVGQPFNPMAPAVLELPLTADQWLDRYPGEPITLWKDAIGEAAERGLIDGTCNRQRLYVFVTPVECGAGGMIGAENWGCDHVLPGAVAMTGWAGRLLGGLESGDWTTWNSAMGALAHELGHASALLKHYDGWTEEQQAAFSMWGTVMYNWWSWQENEPESIRAPGFAPFEKEALLATDVFSGQGSA